jgi:hypothetical protein
LRTNIKSLQRWGNNYDISGRIKESIVLYDQIFLEAGTFTCTYSEMALEHFTPWNEENTKDNILKELEKAERMPDEGYITVLDGKTHAEKYKYRSTREEQFIADYRTVDILSEIENSSFGKDMNFIKYALVVEGKKHKELLEKNLKEDLSNPAFVETASKTYGKIQLMRMLNNLNDSLALSQAFGMPIAIDAMHSPLLRAKTQQKFGLDFTVLERLCQIVVPDFSKMDLESLLELRKDNAIESFRGLISRIGSKLQSDKETEIDELLVEEMMKEIKEIAPNNKRFILDASLGALSFVPLPLVSIGTTVTGLGKEFKEIKDFSKNWLSFILRTTEEPHSAENS